MTVEEIEICQDCGKQIQKSKGSITQWLGLGDSCKCELAQAATGDNPKKTKGKTCRRCKLPIGSNQSMTQWLIRKETCKCSQKEGATATDYAQKALSKQTIRKYRQSNKEGKQLIAYTIAGFCFLFLFLSTCALFLCETLGITRFGKKEETKTRTIFISLYQRNSYLARIPMPEKEADWNTPAVLNADVIAVRHYSLSDKDLKNIARHSQALSIELESCDGYTENGIRELSENKCLKSLSLEGSKVDNYIVQVLAKGRLETINLSSTKVKGLSLVRLAENPHLQTLILEPVSFNNSQAAKFRDAGFQWFSNQYFRVTPSSRQ